MPTVLDHTPTCPATTRPARPGPDAARWLIAGHCAEFAGEITQMVTFALAGAVLYAMLTTGGLAPTALSIAFLVAALTCVPTLLVGLACKAKAQRLRTAATSRYAPYPAALPGQVPTRQGGDRCC